LERKINNLKISIEESGLETIKKTIVNVSEGPGVYRMINVRGEALYVGKAKNLKTRLKSYTLLSKLTSRLKQMIKETKSLEIIDTHTEVEALLLESNIIKKLKPKYNILLKDDKSFSYIIITGNHTFPRIMKYRGSKKSQHKFFGPFASTGAVNETLIILQRAFLLRSCSDNVFNNRSRPCLLYQIKRCSAPCVDKIPKDEYYNLIFQAEEFLKGNSKKIQNSLANNMENSSKNYEYEKAAIYRDRIKALSSIQSKQEINFNSLKDLDVIALHRESEKCCIQVFFIRKGQNYGNRSYFPSQTSFYTNDKILEAFINQFYQSNTAPPEILVSELPSNTTLINEVLSLKSKHKVNIHKPYRGNKKKVVIYAKFNAKNTLLRKLSEYSLQKQSLTKLVKKFNLKKIPKRIEVYDNSHISGTNMVGAMIVSGKNGFEKKSYRKFNIKNNLENGDDYGAMQEVLTRRFERANKEDPKKETNTWPDLIIIDGGKGQLNIAQSVLKALKLSEIPIIAISKGLKRIPGEEQFHYNNNSPIRLNKTDPLLFFLQRLRDEAHRFAISSHRNQRSKNLVKSELDLIPGVGAKRKKTLLHTFGSKKGIMNAGINDLVNVKGISKSLANDIYNFFH